MISGQGAKYIVSALSAYKRIGNSTACAQVWHGFGCQNTPRTLKFEPQSHMIGDALARQTACCRPRTQPLSAAHLIAVLPRYQLMRWSTS